MSGDIEWGHMGTDTLLARSAADGPLAQAQRGRAGALALQQRNRN